MKVFIGLVLIAFALLDMTYTFSGVAWLGWVSLGMGLVLGGVSLARGAFRMISFVVMVWVALLLLRFAGIINF